MPTTTEFNYTTGYALEDDGIRAQYAGSGNGAGLAGALEAAADWKAAQDDHGHTSYWGVVHVRDMRAYWLGVARAIRHQG